MNEQGPPPKWGGAEPPHQDGDKREKPAYAPASGAAQSIFDRPGPWGFWATIVWLFAMFAAALAASLVAMLAWTAYLHLSGRGAETAELLRQVQSNGDFVWISELFLFVFVGAVLVLAVASRRSFPARDYLALKPPAWKALVAWLGGLCLFVAASDLIIHLWGASPVAEWMRDIYASASCLPCLLAALIVLAPVLEELVFRGFIFTGVQERLGPFWAVVFATAPWALLHLQYEWYYMVVGFMLGMLFCIARWRTGSIYVSIIMHALSNIIATLETTLFS